MKLMNNAKVRASLAVLNFGLITSIVACGGGGADIGSGGTGNTPPATTTPATVVGPITGFGSVIINGVKFDDSSSSLVDDRNNSISKDSLRLGMLLEVSGRVSSDNVTAVATQMRLLSELQGAISQIDLASGRIIVLGVPVIVTPTTSYSNVAGIASLILNDLIEVHGLRDPATQAIIATRIERKPSAGIDSYLVGTVRNQNASTTSFEIGSSTAPLTVRYGTASVLPTGSLLANGQAVRVESQSLVGSVITASRVYVLTPASTPLIGRAEVEGIVSDYVGLSSFKVNGLSINGAAALFLRGDASLIKNGVRVEAKGDFNGTVLQASVLKIESLSGGSGGSDDSTKFEVKGAITSFTSTADFVVRNVRINASTAEFKNGSAALLAKDRQVEVKGQMRGEFLVATEVKFD
jgi:Domain of unknown function (DUF5666)